VCMHIHAYTRPRHGSDRRMTLIHVKAVEAEKCGKGPTGARYGAKEKVKTTCFKI
jgi:hypothetical protein